MGTEMVCSGQVASYRHNWNVLYLISLMWHHNQALFKSTHFCLVCLVYYWFYFYFPAEMSEPPNIFLTLSQSVVLPGENVEFGCSTSSDICPTTVFHLYRDGASIMNRSASVCETSVTFLLPHVDSSSQGNYTCAYSPNFNESTSIPISVGK